MARCRGEQGPARSAECSTHRHVLLLTSSPCSALNPRLIRHAIIFCTRQTHKHATRALRGCASPAAGARRPALARTGHWRRGRAAGGVPGESRRHPACRRRAGPLPAGEVAGAAASGQWQRGAACRPSNPFCLGHQRFRLPSTCLQGLVTNDVSGLEAPGAPPQYAAILNAQGRYLHDLFLHRTQGASCIWARASACGTKTTQLVGMELLCGDGPLVRPSAVGGTPCSTTALQAKRHGVQALLFPHPLPPLHRQQMRIRWCWWTPTRRESRTCCAC